MLGINPSFFCLLSISVFWVHVVNSDFVISRSYHDITDHPANCSPDLGVEDGTSICRAVRIKWSGDEGKVTSQSARRIKELFEKTLSEDDPNHLVRRMYIDIHTDTLKIEAQPSTSATTSLDINTIFGEALDMFLTPRPWWVITKEIYGDRKSALHSIDPPSGSSTEAGAGVGAGTDTKTGGGQRIHISLLRFSQRHEPHLRFLASVQYPPTASICAKTPLHVGHMVNSGWGSHLNAYSGIMADGKYQITEIYDSNTNLPNEGVAYASASTCPHLINKRHCAFLPLTNCTLPDLITKSKGGVDYKEKVFPSDFMYFSEASPNGVVVRDGNKHVSEPKNEYHEELKKKYEQPGLLSKPFVLNEFLDGNTPGVPTKNKVQGHCQNSPYTNVVLPGHGLIWRPNALYRSLIAKRIAAEKNLRPWPPGSQCVAMHIRRGDRTYSQINMREFCANHTRIGTGMDNCRNKWTNEKHSCDDLGDKGCFTRHPFGALTLQEYLDKSWQLLQTRNVFIMTDDGEWLKREKEKVSSEWKIFTLSAALNSRAHDSKEATNNGVDFLASIELVRNCQAFVGHWGSGVSHLGFHAMCFHHGAKTGVCPPACDFKADWSTGEGPP